MKQLNKPTKFLKSSILVLIGTILIKGFAGSGINMTASLFLSPVAEDIGVGIGTLSLYFSIASIVMIFWLPLAGRLMGKYNVKALVIISAFLQALSFASLGLFNSVWGWYVMAIPQTIGAAILVNLLSPIMVNRWFPSKTGLILGIQAAFVWLFAAALQPITSSIIENQGWRYGYIILGLAAFTVVIISALSLLRNKPNDEEIKLLDTQIGGGEQKKSNHINIDEKEAVHSRSFIMLLIFMVALTGAGVFTQHIPTYAALINYQLSQIGMAMALSSIGGAVGAITIGIASDKIGGLKTCFGIIILWILAVIGFIFGKSSFPIFALSCFLHGVASSSIAIISPILTLLFFGKQDYEKIYAKVAMGAPIASILLVPAYGFVYDATGSYLPILILLFGLLILAAISIIYGWKIRCDQNGCPVRQKPHRASK